MHILHYIMYIFLYSNVAYKYTLYHVFKSKLALERALIKYLSDFLIRYRFFQIDLFNQR